MRNAGDPNNFKYIFMFENVSCLKILDIVLTVQKWGDLCLFPSLSTIWISNVYY